MSQILHPRIILLDSATFIKIVNDYWAKETNKKKNAEKIITFLCNNGLVPLLTWHHIEELLQIEDNFTVSRRLSLIKQFPVIAWPITYEGNSSVGQILDLNALEIKKILDNPSISALQVIKSIKCQLFQYNSGEEFIETHYDEWKVLRPHWIKRVERKREIESIAHTMNYNKNTKLRDIKSSSIRNPSDAYRSFERLGQQLVEDLKHKGDEKLTDVHRTAYEFINDVLNIGLNIYKNDKNKMAFSKILEALGIDGSNFTDKTTISEIGYASIIQKKLEIVAEKLGITYKNLKSKIKGNLPPSLFLWLELTKASESQKRGHGSNIIDRYLVPYACYADFTEVDKRTLDCLTRSIQAHSIIKQMTNIVFKLKKYIDLQPLISQYL